MREMLKSPFRKLRNFALSKQGSSEESPPGIGGGLRTDVAKLMQDAEDMRVKFEGFLTNGLVISGAAYDFSRSLQDMATYMTESFGEIVDGEIGNIFNLLAKGQFEISKLLDLFAAHVSETIIKPTEEMMTRIQEAAIMKNQYDEKWKVYIVTQLEKQKRKSKRGKGSQVKRQSVMSYEGFTEQANAFNLYMQSLMQRQSDSLVTQAVKYHSAQMHLFSKALASMNAMEPMMRKLASEKIIERGFSEEEVSKISLLRTEMDKKGKVLTFDSETDSMASSPSYHLVVQTEPVRFSSDSSEESPPGRASVISKSEPISPLMHHRREGTAKASTLESEQERVRMYALPSPVIGAGKWVENSMHTSNPQKFSGADTSSAYHSGSLLEGHMPSRITDGINNAVRDIFLSRQVEDQMQQHQFYKSRGTSKNPAFFVEDAIDDDSNNLPTESIKQYSQSGPLRDSAWALNKSQRANVRNACTNENLSPLYKSGPISRSPVCSYTTCDPPFPPLSVPQISELHKLPPPPPGTLTPPKSPNHTPTAYSAPLGNMVPSPTAYSAPSGNTVPSVPNQAGGASPLPSPPVNSISRSLSIPTSTTRVPDTKDL